MTEHNSPVQWISSYKHFDYISNLVTSCFCIVMLFIIFTLDVVLYIECRHCFLNSRLTCSRETWATAPPYMCVGKHGSNEQHSVANDNNAVKLGFKSISVFAGAPDIYQGQREEINSP